MFKVSPHKLAASSDVDANLGQGQQKAGKVVECSKTACLEHNFFTFMAQNCQTVIYLLEPLCCRRSISKLQLKIVELNLSISLLPHIANMLT